MDARVRPSDVSGAVQAPPSKSYTHRAILAAGMGEAATVRSPLLSADTRATMRAVRAFGGQVVEDEGTLEVVGLDGTPQIPADVIDCANSGTTMRLAIGTAALVDGTTVLTGDASLRDRPQGPLLGAIDELGGRAWSTRGNGQAPVIVEGPIEGGRVGITGEVSSQFITSLLMAGAATEQGIDIDLETPLKSAPYVDITVEVLEAFDIAADRTGDGFRVEGGQGYRRADPYAVPGDFSSISYLLAAGAVAGAPEVEIRGAVPSAQGDTAIVDIAGRMGAELSWDRDAGRLAVRRSALSGATIDVSDTPDLLPTIAALGAVADGRTHITNCEHVRYKETDRVSAMATELARLGAEVEEEQDTLTVHGEASELVGATVDGYDDHRVIMALSLVGLAAEGETEVRGAEHVDVSFPTYFETLEGLGAAVELSA